MATEKDDSDELSTPDSTDTPETTDKPELGADEVYCTSCGEAIKKDAEICPDCGVRQKGAEDTATHTASGNVPDSKVYELQKIARKDTTTAILLSILVTPAGYVYVGKPVLAILNFLTFNYFLLGFVIVPFHTRKLIREARDELQAHGTGW